MDKKIRKNSGFRISAFTLLETLVVITLTAMLSIAVLRIYHHVRKDAVIIHQRLGDNQLAEEIAQAIAEDLDQIVASGMRVRITVQNKRDNGFYSAKLTISSTFEQVSNPQTNVYKTVIWQSDYDAYEDSLILYRLQTGHSLDEIDMEKDRQQQEDKVMIPMAVGLTHFEVQAVNNQNLVSTWRSTVLPGGIQIGVSTAAFEETYDGSLELPLGKIIYRAVALDRTRMLSYTYVGQTYDVNDLLIQSDPNSLEEGSESGEDWDDYLKALGGESPIDEDTEP